MTEQPVDPKPSPEAVAAAKAERAAALAKSRELKAIENYVKSYFSRPFSRSLKYIYTGMLPSVETFVLGTTLDEKLNYRDGNQVIGFVSLKATEKRDAFMSWLSYFQIPFQTPGICYLENLILLCNKAKWDQTKIEISVEPMGPVYGSVWVENKDAGAAVEEPQVEKPEFRAFSSNTDDEELEEVTPTYTETIVEKQNNMTKITKLLYVPTEYYAARLQIADLALLYHPIVILNEGSFHDILFETDDPNHALEITADHLSFTGNVFETSRVVLFRGYDLIHVSSLKLAEGSYTTGLRIWPEGYRCFNYGSFLTDGEATMVSIRTNTAIFPRFKESGT